MDGDDLKQIRSFNRTVTQRIGALYDEYLGRSRPLGASRVLWEIDDDGTRVRTLRIRLNLDSGYLSRLLRSLEDDDLVEVAASDADNRVRTVELTGKGREEQQLLDAHSDDLARSLLEPLSSSQQERLIDAMGVVERLLTAGLVQIDVEDPTTAAAQMCLRSYFEELDRRFSSGFDPEMSISADVDELTPPAGLLLVARLRDEPVACGALKFHGTDPAEAKRMWVSPSVRGLGLGRRILEELEAAAWERGVTILRLETNDSLTEAINLYRSAGYQEVDPFNDEPYAHHWFEKTLVNES